MTSAKTSSLSSSSKMKISKKKSKYNHYYSLLIGLAVVVVGYLFVYPQLESYSKPLKVKPPPAILPMSLAEVDELFQKVYKKRLGYHLEDKEKKFMVKEGGDTTYGEILSSSAEKLIHDIFKLEKGSVLYDFGSGVGKFIVQARLTSEADRIIGLELSPSRAHLARKSLEKLKEMNVIPENDEKIQLIEANFLKYNISNADAIYMCSTCFNEELMGAIYNQIMEQCKVGLKVISLVMFPIPEQDKLKSRRLVFQKIHTLPMTWSNKSPGHYYILVDDPVDDTGANKLNDDL